MQRPAPIGDRVTCESATPAHEGRKDRTRLPAYSGVTAAGADGCSLADMINRTARECLQTLRERERSEGRATHFAGRMTPFKKD